MKWGWIVGALLAIAVLPARADADALRFEMHTFMPSLALELSGASSSKTLDLKDRFGMRDISTMETKLYLSDRIRLSYRDFNYRGTSDWMRAITPELRIDSDIGLQYGGVSLIAPIQQTARWSVSGVVDVKGYSVDGQMRALYSDHELLTTDQTKISGVAPTFGLMVSGDVTEDLRMYGEFSALPLGSFGSFWEADGGFQYRVRDHSFFHIGYRAVDLVTNNAALKTSLHTKLNGPYFGLNYAF